jgi:hypothetical protein
MVAQPRPAKGFLTYFLVNAALQSLDCHGIMSWLISAQHLFFPFVELALSGLRDTFSHYLDPFFL